MVRTKFGAGGGLGGGEGEATAAAPDSAGVSETDEMLVLLFTEEINKREAARKRERERERERERLEEGEGDGAGNIAFHTFLFLRNDVCSMWLHMYIFKCNERERENGKEEGLGFVGGGKRSQPQRAQNHVGTKRSESHQDPVGSAANSSSSEVDWMSRKAAAARLTE